jgi:hypothetical protein
MISIYLPLLILKYILMIHHYLISRRVTCFLTRLLAHDDSTHVHIHETISNKCLSVCLLTIMDNRPLTTYRPSS